MPTYGHGDCWVHSSGHWDKENENTIGNVDRGVPPAFTSYVFARDVAKVCARSLSGLPAPNVCGICKWVPAGWVVRSGLSQCPGM